VGVDAVLVGGGAEVVLVGGFEVVLVGGGALVVLVGGLDVVVEVALQLTASMLPKTIRTIAINNSLFMLSITSTFPIGFARLKGV
jgi:hypothetical protein